MGYMAELRKMVGSRPLLMLGANVIVVNNNNQMLLQLRTDNQCWGLPGGSLELGEKLEFAATRELKEETGIIAEELHLFKIYSGEEFYYKYPHGDEVYNVTSTYICKEFSGNLIGEISEVKELKFYEFNAIPININPPDRQAIIDYIQQYQ
ncbi:NUDIX hydrolase [Lederbergia lenta]|uniref:Putative MutT/Nudix family protein n=1 Tax=Lederbergia lenta TaxID=1467 RepID=A0A2X4WIU3_LEDLE|nr:NUDIX domain-containing protein [Lederbergia lenta]MCM3109773.1 NUDIX domain-containing protein [Lederbergia lenta]MEC2324477.1 NUDIX domain-containing protein [Lederbergia lenta]SQI59798.1 putative MutT/Nudix family protein [Lederbergia lenta]